MGVRISQHAIARAQERKIPRSVLTKIAQRAGREGEGNYAISNGWVVVTGDCVVTVLEREMQPDSRLPIR